MAYDLCDRFPPSSKPYYLLDPGAYQCSIKCELQENKYPFLSKTPRKTLTEGKIWTHAIYDANTTPKIPNCISLKSKTPRFSYEAFTEEDLIEILCRCGIESPCKCVIEEDFQNEELLCQAKVKKRLFKGCLSALQEIKYKKIKHSPPFYNVKINESTAYYQGSKWSKRTSKRQGPVLELKPGPADYTITRDDSSDTKCAEKLRAYRRKTSKQLRFIELVQNKNLLQNFPGPGAYDPSPPKSFELKYNGPKAKRFSTYAEGNPSPESYTLKRYFDPVQIPNNWCQARLPESASFGMKALRFQDLKIHGPSPASYNASYKPCKIKYCGKAAFGSTAKRFKEDDEMSDDSYSDVVETNGKELCPTLTWCFKSKTPRMKQLIKESIDNQETELKESKKIREGNKILLQQYIAPFGSSEARFQPWHNWIPVFGKTSSPGPGYYNSEKPKCYPAVRCGPLSRSSRFMPSDTPAPAPNQYKINYGIETVLFTHNRRLNDMIEKQHKFPWKPPRYFKDLSLEEKEAMLIEDSLKILDDRSAFE